MINPVHMNALPTPGCPAIQGALDPQRRLGIPARPGMRTGFTLVEVLVVISIIAMLTALLLLGNKAARKLGNQATTMNNMRQIGVAMVEYAGDNDGKLPGPLTVAVFNWVDTGTEATVCSLGRYIYPYLGSCQTRMPWLGYPTRSYVPALDCPALPLKGRHSEVAQFVKLDFDSSSANNIFGGSVPNGTAYANRGAINLQPKTLAGLTHKASRTPILTTADQLNWNASPLLPSKGVFDGKRLYLFIDGSVQGPTLIPAGAWSP